MDGYFAVGKTSHYMVSSSDGAHKPSSLSLGNYTMSAWAVSFGIRMREITSRAGEIKAVNFVSRAKSYSSGVSNWRGTLILSVRNSEFFDNPPDSAPALTAPQPDAYRPNGLIASPLSCCSA